MNDAPKANFIAGSTTPSASMGQTFVEAALTVVYSESLHDPGRARHDLTRLGLPPSNGAVSLADATKRERKLRRYTNCSGYPNFGSAVFAPQFKEQDATFRHQVRSA